MTNIKFGTDGYRAITDKDFTKNEVTKIMNGITSFSVPQKTFLIGYDPRKKADEFAAFAAEILRNAGFNVLLSSKIVPTPILAYNAKLLKSPAIMFTASHNPPQYSGLKYITEEGCPADEKITDKIVKNLDFQRVKDIESQKDAANIVLTDFSENYFKHIENIIDFKKIKDAKIDFVYDGLYSAAIGYFDMLLKRNNITFEAVNIFHDPNFGGGLPEPREKFMKKAKAGKMCVANDGDGDRFGVIDEKGNWISPNYIIAILAKHLKNKGEDGVLIKTVGASMMLDDVAKKLDARAVTTKVGFKWVAQAMKENKTLIGGEESGGLSIESHIREKDGILANLLILEAMAYSGKNLFELVEDIKNFCGREYYTDRVDIKLSEDIQIPDFKSFGNFKIAQKNTLDGVKYFLDDGKSTVLVRKSGTEPLLRIYFESDSFQKISYLKAVVKSNII